MGKTHYGLEASTVRITRRLLNRQGISWEGAMKMLEHTYKERKAHFAAH